MTSYKVGKIYLTRIPMYAIYPIEALLLNQALKAPSVNLVTLISWHLADCCHDVTIHIFNEKGSTNESQGDVMGLYDILWLH